MRQLEPSEKKVQCTVKQRFVEASKDFKDGLSGYIDDLRVQVKKQTDRADELQRLVDAAQANQPGE